MEDAHIALNELPGHPTVGLFAVFDGHGGGEIARFCANHFVEQLLKRPSFSKGQFGEALKETFIQLELMLKMKPAI